MKGSSAQVHLGSQGCLDLSGHASKWGQGGARSLGAQPHARLPRDHLQLPKRRPAHLFPPAQFWCPRHPSYRESQAPAHEPLCSPTRGPGHLEPPLKSLASGEFPKSFPSPSDGGRHPQWSTSSSSPVSIIPAGNSKLGKRGETSKSSLHTRIHPCSGKHI